MDLDKIQRLLEIVAESGMAEVKVEEGDFKLTVRAQAPSPPPVVMAAPAAPVAALAPVGVAAAAPVPAAAPAAPAAPPEPGAGAHEALVQAPIVGTFYAAPSPDSPPFVAVGDRVSVGQTLCIIEAMKLMNEIQSEVAGVVSHVLVTNGQPVEYDQPLFVVDTQ